MMTHLRTNLALASIAALGLLIVGGCEQPSPATPFDQARAAFAAGQWAESIMFSTEAINQHPDDVRGYVLRGRAFRRLGQFEPAITDFTIAIQLNPKNPEFYYLRADAYKDQGDIELSDADDKAGQKLDPSYQRAYLFAPPDGSVGLPLAAQELSRTLKDDDRDSADGDADVAGKDSAEGLTKHGRRARHRLSARSSENADHALDTSSDELVDAVAAGPQSADPPEIKDIYGLPVAAELNRPTGGLFSPESIRPGASAADMGRFRAGLSGRPSALRGPASADGGRVGLAGTDIDPRLAEQGRAQRGSGNIPPEYYQPQRSLHPFGAAAMRPTGVPSESSDEEFVGDESESGGSRGQGGGGRFGGSQYGASNGMGGRGYGGPIDPYGGYTRSARPIGGLIGNPAYGGGASPYGAGGGQSAGGRRQGSAPRDGGGAGAAPPNPFGPYPPAPVPFVDPAGLRYD